MKIQTKTAILFTVLTAGMMFCLSVLVYFFATRFTFQDFKKRLQLRAVLAAKVNLEKDETNTIAFHELQKKHIQVLPNQKEYFFLVDSATQDLKTNSTLRLPKSFFKEVLATGEAYYDKNFTSYAGIYYPDNQGNYIVVASAENEYGTETLQNLRTIFLICMIVGMSVVFTVGLFFSRKTFAPVRKIVAKMKGITAQNLHQRLPDPKGQDEISELTYTFNNMLDRLETAFETQNNFISNASHELSTPLTTIIGEAELALTRQRKTEEYEEALRIILQEADRLKQLTSGLLNLAQSSFNTNEKNQENIQVDELLVDVKTAAERIEPSCKIQMDFGNMPDNIGELQINGNRQMLMLALSNIIMNGCKYSSNQPVIVSLSFQKKHLQIKVSDSGIGIPAKDLPHIYDPFFRASNVATIKGYGIGLPLTATILRQHQATINVQSKEGVGTDVIVDFLLTSNAD